MKSFEKLAAAALFALALLVAQILPAAAHTADVHAIAKGTNSYAALPFVKLYPVPAGNHATLRLPAEETGALTVEVMSYTGRHIATLSGLGERLDVSSLAPGSYYLKIAGLRTYRASLIKL